MKKHMKKSRRLDVRERAIRVIGHSLRGKDLQDVLNASQRDLSSQRDRALMAQLCYGYFRLKKRLEFILCHRIKKSFHSLPSSFKIALCLGTYELLYLEKIPSYATLHWYVGFIKKNISMSLGSLANAVLRSIQRDSSIFLSEDFFKSTTPDLISFYSTYYSLPSWMVDFIITYYPDSVSKILEASISPPGIGLRINLSHRQGPSLYKQMEEQGDFIEKTDVGFAFESYPSQEIEHMEKLGLLSRQSIASQKIVCLLRPYMWSEPIWDACAGSGGKCCLLLENFSKDLFASDIKLKGIFRLRQEIARLSLPSIPLFVWDASRELMGKKFPGTILLDVPCSGLGVISRRPDIKWKRKKRDIKFFSSLQLNMLISAKESMRSGKYIVYITCSLHPEENQKTIEKFLSLSPEWGLTEEILPDSSMFKREFFYGALLVKKGA